MSRETFLKGRKGQAEGWEGTCGCALCSHPSSLPAAPARELLGTSCGFCSVTLGPAEVALSWRTLLLGISHSGVAPVELLWQNGS